MKLQADWVEVLEAAYTPAADDRSWAKVVASSVVRLLDRSDELGMLIVQHGAEFPSVSDIVSVTTVDTPRMRTVRVFEQKGVLESLGPTAFRAFCYPPHVANTHLSVDRTLPKAERELMKGLRREAGIVDALALVVHPVPGTVLVLWGLLDDPLRLSPQEVRLLTQLGLHIETAYRLRRRPEVLRAVIGPTGRIEHLAPGARSSSLLASQARAIVQARSKATRKAAQAIDLWRALVDGEVSIVERTIGTRSHYFVLENAPGARPLRVLTRGELDVLSMSARGLSAKLVAYGLGISEASVSQRLASAASKVGVATRAELVRIAAILTRDPRAHLEELGLSVAEHDVLELLAQGLSNGEIARHRSRSVRTIANQVASLLRKTRSPSRRALVARAAS